MATTAGTTPTELPLRLDGPEDGPLLFFLHGFPDDEQLWDPQVKRYATLGYRCARVTMPHFAKHPAIHAGLTWRKSGYSFDELVDMVKDAVERACGGGPVVLVVHDWGSAVGSYMMKKYPDTAGAAVLLDVAAFQELNIGREPTFRNYGPLFGFLLAYQWWDITMWLLARMPLLGPLLGRLMPINYLCAFPYWNWHADHLLHALLRLIGRRWLPSWQTSAVQTFPPCPTLFVWGSAKPEKFKFHKDDWAAGLSSRGDGSRVYGMDAGHWVMTDKDMMPQAPESMKNGLLKPGRPDELHQHMDGFLNDLQQRGVLRTPSGSGPSRSDTAEDVTRLGG